MSNFRAAQVKWAKTGVEKTIFFSNLNPEWKHTEERFSKRKINKVV
jgi:hypothetical protein